MNQQNNKAAEQMIDSASEGELPKVVKDMVLEGVSKSQQANEKWAALMKDAGNNYENLVAKETANARTLGNMLLENSERNTQAFLEHAANALQARDFRSVAEIQARFASEQLAIANEQTAEFFELSATIFNEMLNVATGVATTTAEQIRTAI